MAQIVKPRTAIKPQTKRPPLYKVILLNDDFTPREFVVQYDGAPARRLRDCGLHPGRG